MTDSVRIRKLLELCTPVHTAADIGADHGYTGAALLQSGLASKVIATDISLPSLQKARTLFAQLGLHLQTECRAGDGISVLAPGEAGGIIISGMGGQLILRILQACPQVAKEAEWLVISPQSNIDVVRRTLPSLGLRIVCEDVALEDGKYYPLLRLEPGQSEVYSEAECYTGKRELMRNGAAFLEYMRHLAVRQQEILQLAKGSRSEGAVQTLYEIYAAAAKEEA